MWTSIPKAGTEQGGIRPALVVSVSRFNAIPHRPRIVVPITSTDKGLSNHVRAPPPRLGRAGPWCMPHPLCVTFKSLL